MGIGEVSPPFLRTSSTRLLMPHWFQFFTGFGMSLPRTCASHIIRFLFAKQTAAPIGNASALLSILQIQRKRKNAR